MYNNILVPIVFDHGNYHSNSLDLARILGGPDAKVTLLHVVEFLPGYVASYISQDDAKRLRGEMLKDMKVVADSIPGAESKIVEGHSGRTINEYANHNAIDLIIVESHRPGLEDYFLGSTASQIVRHAKCAVHVIR